LKAKVSKSNA